MIKRLFDILSSLIGLLAGIPLFLLISVLIKLDSPGPVFFRQERIGRGFIPFRICKFRTMAVNQAEGISITSDTDIRVTRVGRLLRATKMDELPQLFNVLTGDMSVVGPRPEVPRYVEMFRADYEVLLTIRPGMTDLASLRYRNEGALLARAEDPEEEYIAHILPDKIRLGKAYLRHTSMLLDLSIIGETLFRLVWSEPSNRKDG